MKRVLVTGGSGFIGSCLVRTLIASGKYQVLNYDKLTYAAHPDALKSIQSSPQYQFVHGDILDGKLLRETATDFSPEILFHLAAESHVDRSIAKPADFIQTNIVGTSVLLDVALECHRLKSHFKLMHVSTDEVFGSIESGSSTEKSPYNPSSPYSASKAASDHLVRAWSKTYGLNAIISYSSNNYGPFQHTEKLIPLMIDKALKNLPLPVYGNGLQVRDWLHVEDHVAALILLSERGMVGESYNIGAGNERSNLEVVRLIKECLNSRSEIQFVENRKGHDQRYSLDTAKLRGLGWHPGRRIEEELKKMF